MHVYRICIFLLSRSTGPQMDSTLHCHSAYIPNFEIGPLEASNLTHLVLFTLSPAFFLVHNTGDDLTQYIYCVYNYELWESPRH